MTSCDLNCDMGEGIGNDEAIMPFITSANVACGYHAGDETTMTNTVMLAQKAGVAVGAHPSFADRENFGRTEMKAVSPREVYQVVTDQLQVLLKVVTERNVHLHHVKPHGALYNMSARDPALARAIAKAIYDFDKTLILYGLSGSHSIEEANAIGIKTASEVFADRTYQDDGSLTPRSRPDALIENVVQCTGHVIQMIKEGKVMSTTGKEVLIKAETICLHGDGKNAATFANAIYKKLKAENIRINPF